MDSDRILIDSYLHSSSCLYSSIPNSHSHWEVFFVLSGTLRLICGTTPKILQPGDVCLVTPHTLHLIQPLEEGAETLIFSSDRMENFFLHLLPETRYLWNHYPELCDFFRSGLQISEHIEWQEYYQQNNLSGHLGVCFSLLLQSAMMARPLNVCRFPQNPLVLDIFSYLSEHWNENITRDTLSKYFFLSQSHLSKIFTEYAGASPIETLIRCRMSEAMRLLITTSESIQEISVYCGYHSLTAFTRLFTRRYGCSPSDYRKKFSSQSYYRNQIVPFCEPKIRDFS